MSRLPDLAERVPLAPRTTLGLGGAARHFVTARDEETLRAGLEWARREGLATFVLGGGSNVLVADEGFDGLVIDLALEGVSIDGDRLRAAAGEGWDALVARAVAADLAGLECLSGIPGRVGATPIQNVGAYGQEVGDTIVEVRAIDRQSLEEVILRPEELDFAYRDSALKRAPGRHVVLEVTFALKRGGRPALRYGELTRALGGRAEPTLAEVRETVIRLRRAKSMVVDPDDENRRSAGSFFLNPIVLEAEAEAVVALALREGLVARAEDVPRWPAPPSADGLPRVKLAAGWLIERAGVQKGLRRGAVGVSSRHALSLVHHGGGLAADLVALAREIRARVEDRFGLRLVPEPVFLGFSEPF